MRRIITTRLRAGALGLGVALSVAGLWVAAAPAAHAGTVSYSVFVGYADQVHGASSSFPTPWLGDSGVTFAGCQPAASCSYDAGAVRIVNTGTSPLPVDDVKVNVSTCAFDPWSPSTIPVGGQLILTQTTSGAGSGCPTDGTMDTSDVGPNGGDYVGGGCDTTGDGIVPIVDVTVNGQMMSFDDTREVLNTGGIDVGTCSGISEATQWSAIGTACPTATLALTPATQTVAVGTNATETATLTNSCGTPLSGVTVNLAVTSGPNVGATPSAVTNASGVATLTYPGTQLGTDVDQASVTTLGGTFTSNSTDVTWVSTAQPCPAGQSCTATVNVPNAVNVQVTGTSSTTATIDITVAPGNVACTGTFKHAPLVTTLTAPGFTSTSPKTVTLTIDKKVVQQQGPDDGVAHYGVCYQPLPLPSTPFLLPMCRDVGNTPPCVVSRDKKNGNVVEVFIVPGSDPLFW